MTLSLRSRVLLLLLLLAGLGAGIGAYLLWFRKDTLPPRGSPRYLEYQRAFQIGVAALDAGREDLTRKSLTRAIELIPDEPAAWANLGLMNLRKNNLEQAAKELNQAHKMAPESGEIEALLGLLAEKQGRFPDAVAHLRKAVEKDPRDLASLFTLAEVVSREGGADSEAEFQKLMEQILKAQPNNLPVLVQRAGSAFRRKDQAAFRDSLERFIRLAPNWTPLSRKTFDELRKFTDEAPNEIVSQLMFLDNVLKAERGYARDSFAIRPQPGVIGVPIQRFLRLEPMRPTPAPPDYDLTFKLEQQTRGKPAASAPWDVVRPMWFINEEQREALVREATVGGFEVRPADVFKQAILLANAREVRRTDIDTFVLPFPSGSKAVAPSTAGMLALDWDNDFRTDLLLAGAGGLRFWQQRANGSFDDVAAATELPADILGGDYYGAWAADIEMDGDLDIIVARRSGPPLVLRNNRDGTFKAIEPFTGVKDVRAFAWADLDNDGAADAVFLDSAGNLHVYANDRAGQFSPWPLPGNLGTFLALTVADVNGDGSFDIVALRADGTLLCIFDKDKRHKWEIAELAHWKVPADAAIGNVALFVEDLDNNGALDIVVAGPRAAQVYLADDQGKFAELPAVVSMRVSAVLDVDRDGRLDFLGLSADGQPTRALNQSKKGYRWQAMWPLANPKAGDERNNSHAIGSEIEVQTGPLVQKQLINAPVVHFGLGEQNAVDVARIVWPNGIPQWEFDIPADSIITSAQRLSGSCPFLFTYDGAGMRFSGDFMWGTPLGMYVNGQNTGDFAQTTEWLKIRGEHLKPRLPPSPRGGRGLGGEGEAYYDIRVHANLWETDYFDQLGLIVVDHPPNTEIFVDERFFLTPTPPKLHVTTAVKPVARAWDHHGKDASAEVTKIDGVYLDRAGRGRFQGITRDHWVEVDLGDDAPAEGPVMLIAQGWLHPTNSSINVAISQGKHEAPRPLSLEVPDGKGGWKVAHPALGFPAGKDKTMLIRLDGLETGSRKSGVDNRGTAANPLPTPDSLLPVSRRFRLRTNMEIYWDFLGYATELDPKLARLHRPAPLAAELRYRGMLEMMQKNASSPEVPNYDKVIRGRQEWRDLTGFYTRFGDVRELLAKVDDRYVIMNAGDEIALRFPVPEVPAAGWKRDFIWECDGWTRDGDLNTRFGNTVLPLPAHGKIDSRLPGRLEDDPVYRRFPLDWRTYHTRFLSADEFARGLRR